MALLPSPLPGHASGQGRPQGLAKVVIILWPPLPTHPAERGSHSILRLLSTSCPPDLPSCPAGPAPDPDEHLCLSVGICAKSTRVACVQPPERWGSWIHLPCFPGSLLQSGSWLGVTRGIPAVHRPHRQLHRGEGQGQRRGWRLGGVREAFSRRWVGGCTESFLCAVLGAQRALSVESYFISRLDHCSPLLLPLPLLPPEPLQSTQPAAARAMLPNRKSDHITPHSPAPPQLPIMCGSEAKPWPQHRPGLPSLGVGREGWVLCTSANSSPPPPSPPPSKLQPH